MRRRLPMTLPAPGRAPACALSAPDLGQDILERHQLARAIVRFGLGERLHHLRLFNGREGERPPLLRLLHANRGRTHDVQRTPRASPCPPPPPERPEQRCLPPP